MIDHLQKLAQTIRPARTAVLVLGVALGLYVGYSVLIIEATDSDFTLPALLGLMWCLSVNAFITAFAAAPAKAENSQRLTLRLKRAMHRGFYLFMAVAWVAATLVLAVLTVRLGAIWIGQG